MTLLSSPSGCSTASTVASTLSASSTSPLSCSQPEQTNIASARSLAAFLLNYMKTTKVPIIEASHCVKLPPINLDQYIERFSQMLRCSEGCFTLAGVYLKRFLQKRPDVKVDALNAHRLALVSLVVAAKYNDDTYFTNSYYSYCGGIPLENYNSMEKEFVFSIKFKLFVSPEEFETQQVLQNTLISLLDVPSVAAQFHQQGVIILLPGSHKPAEGARANITYMQVRSCMLQLFQSQQPICLANARSPPHLLC